MAKNSKSDEKNKTKPGTEGVMNVVTTNERVVAHVQVLPRVNAE